MAVKTLQVTIGASATALVASGNLIAKWVVFQNNGSNSMRIGDSNASSTRGLQLAAGGSFYQPALPTPSATNLASWYVSGTQNDKLDVIYDDGQ